MILVPYEESVKPVEAPETSEATSPESKHGFTIGDIVIPNSDKFKGKQCIVKVLGSCSVGVQCPSGVGLGHTLDGRYTDDTGWWYHPSSLELVSKEEPMDLTEIMPGVGSFKVGDKVVAHSKLFEGCTGTIVRIHPDGQPPLGVQFEKYHSTGHTLDGNCPMGYGWYYDKSDLTLVVEDKSLSKPSTPTTPSVPPPKEDYVTVRIFTEEEFKAKDLWDTYDDKEHPTGWNSNGKMNKYLGTYIQVHKSSFNGDNSFGYDNWHFRVDNYEVIYGIVETKVKPKKPEMKPQRFKVGDKVTYKSVDEFGGSYCHGGLNQGGYVGTIKSYASYYSTRNCYTITVSTKDGGEYAMLESEFYEYDSIHPKVITSATSLVTDVCTVAPGTANIISVPLDTWGVHIHKTSSELKEVDNLARYDQAPVILQKKPKRKLIVLKTY
jgi:hypothetical protein